LLSVLLAKYLELKKRDNVKLSSRNLYRGHIQTFIDVVGDKESSKLTYEDVEKFVQCLPKIPRNRKKHPFDKYSIDEILDMTFDESLLLAEGSWSGYATNIRAYLSLYTKRQFIDPLAITAIEGEFTNPVTYPYLPYEQEDLKGLFHSDEYLNGKHKKASNYWCPLIALFTGARSNEICQLTLSDIRQEEVDGKIIEFIDINQEEDKE
jgi:integrase